MIHRIAEGRGSRLAIALAGALCALALTAQPSHAGVLVDSTPSCAAQATARVFQPWLDLANYQLAPDGGFEAGAKDWALAGGARTVSGNESNFVGGRADKTALQIPAGGSAASPAFCVGLEHPTARLFAKRTGGTLLSTLRVDVQFSGLLGQDVSLPIGLVLGDGQWAPTLPVVMVANLLPLLPGEHTPVKLRFVPHGAGSWTIDDVYVDPFKHF